MRDRDPMATPFRFRLKVEGLFYNTTEGSRVEKKTVSVVIQEEESAMDL